MGAGECYIYVLKRSVRGGGSLDISRLPGIPGGRKHYTLVAESTIYQDKHNFNKKIQ